MKRHYATTLATTGLALAMLLCLPASGRAADKAAFDPTGKWTLSTSNPDSQSKSKAPASPMSLKLEGGKLTGSITHQSNINGKVLVRERVLKETKLEGDEISFTVSFPPTVGEGAEVTQTYHGKITGDTMKGKLETEWNGNTFKRDWEAKRVKP